MLTVNITGRATGTAPSSSASSNGSTSTSGIPRPIASPTITSTTPPTMTNSQRTRYATSASAWSVGRAICTSSVVRPKYVRAPVAVTTPVASPPRITDPEYTVASGGLLGVLGFPGQHRLVDAEGPTEQSHVGWDDVSLPDAGDVARNEIPRRQRLPVSFPKHASVHLQAAAKRVHDALGSALLDEGDDGIQGEEGDRDRQVRVSVQGPRQHGDRLEHPGRQAPELRQERENCVALLLRTSFRPVLLPPSLDLCVRRGRCECPGGQALARPKAT